MSQSTPTSTRDARPWSHRCNVAARYLIDMCSGLAVGALGTVAHRMGAAQNIPYGLALAFLLVGLSAWSARSRDGVAGFAVHMTCSTLMVWLMAMVGPGGDVMVPMGFNSDTLPWLSQHCGAIWLWGATLLQVAMLFLPSRWFRIPDRKAAAHARDGRESAADGEARA